MAKPNITPAAAKKAAGKLNHLAETTKGRRQSVLPDDAPEEVTAATAPEQISSTEQLMYWANKDADRILEMVKKLRQDRDEVLLCIDEWNVMVKNHDAAVEDLLSNQAIMEEKDAEISDLKLQLFKATQQLIKLKNPRDKGKATKVTPEDSMEEQSHEEGGGFGLRGATSPAPSDPPLSIAQSLLTGKVRLSTKLRDPEPFRSATEGPTWEEWVSKLQDKLEANADHFPTTQQQIAYVCSLVSGEAATHLQARRKRTAANTNPFIDAQQVID